MKITAGVILIIAAVFNLFASLGYVAGGSAATYTGTVVVTPKEATTEQAAVTKEAAGNLMLGGGLMMAWGVFLLVSVGILIAAAVFLFIGKKAGFIITAGIIAIIVEGGGIALTSFGITNLVGLVGGILAILAAKQVKVAEESVPATA